MTDSNISVSSSRAGRSAEIEKLIWEMVDALGTIDGVAMNDWGEGDPEFVAARAALLEYVERLNAKLQAIEDVAEGYVNTNDGDHANWVSIMGGMIDETQNCLQEERDNNALARSAIPSSPTTEEPKP